jgi:hypothetical protein
VLFKVFVKSVAAMVVVKDKFLQGIQVNVEVHHNLVGGEIVIPWGTNMVELRLVADIPILRQHGCDEVLRNGFAYLIHIGLEIVNIQFHERLSVILAIGFLVFVLLIQLVGVEQDALIKSGHNDGTVIAITVTLFHILWFLNLTRVIYEKN